MNIMIDIETMGIKLTSAITAVGAVAFIPDTGEIKDTFYSPISLDSSIDAGLTVDASTILWWMKQNDDARKEIHTADKNLSEIMYKLSWWMRSQDITPVVFKCNAFQPYVGFPRFAPPSVRDLNTVAVVWSPVKLASANGAYPDRTTSVSNVPDVGKVNEVVAVVLSVIASAPDKVILPPAGV